MNCCANLLKILLLLAVLLGPTGCATSADVSNDPPPPDATPPSDQDSHGWGASVGGMH
jgi:hypothetical protein